MYLELCMKIPNINAALRQKRVFLELLFLELVGTVICIKMNRFANSFFIPIEKIPKNHLFFRSLQWLSPFILILSISSFTLKFFHLNVIYFESFFFFIFTSSILFYFTLTRRL